MTLPKGFGTGGGASSSDVSKMIGKRVEDHFGIITAFFLALWGGTWAGIAVAVVYYPWAYPPPSAHFAYGSFKFGKECGTPGCRD